MDDALGGELGLELAVDEHAFHVVAAEREHVEVGLHELEDLRLRLLDDADLDAADLRQRLAAHRLDEALVLGIAALRIAQSAIVRIRLEHDARCFLPLLEPIGSGADRATHDVSAGGLDRLARDGHGRQSREPFEQRVVGARELDLQGVAIDRAQACDRRVVVELCAGLARGVDDGPRTHDEIGHRDVAARPQVGVEDARDRIDVVLRNQFALLALEHRIVDEVDPLLHLHRPHRAVVGDDRQRLRCARDHFRRNGKVIELVERLEEVDRYPSRQQIRALLRIEARDVVRRNA
jgi:hypothetical protein